MKTDFSRQQQGEETADDKKPTEHEMPAPINEPLSKAAYDWNHALEIATDKMWGEQAPLLRIVPRK
jgi:hypothetical protein